MNEEYIDNVKHLIEQKDADKVKELLVDLHPADIAELCDDLNPEEARFVYRLLNNETAADVLVEMDEDVRKEFLEMIPSETIAKRFVDYMDTDDAVDLMRDLDEDKQEEILSHIEDIEQAGDIVDLLKYDENTAGGLMGTEMVVVNENWSMPECLKEMRQQAEELDEIYYVYVIDDDERLRGIFPLKKMITSPSVSKVKHVMQKDPISVHVDTSIDEVAQTIEKYDLVAIPVVDSIGRLIGQITVDDVMDEVREQSERDYQLASGLSQDVETDDNVLRPTALATDRHDRRYRKLHDIGKFRRNLCRTPRNGIIHSADWRYGRKRRYTVFRYHRTRACQQFAGRQKHFQASDQGSGSSLNQCYHHLPAGIYLQLYPVRCDGYGYLFRIHQPVCRCDVRLHLRHTGPDDTGETKNRSRHRNRSVYSHHK